MGDTLTPLALSAADLGRLSASRAGRFTTGTRAAPWGLSRWFYPSRVTRWDAAEIGEWWGACRAAGRRIGRAEWLRREGHANG